MALDQNVRLVFDKINNAKKRSPYNQNVELIAATKTRDILQIQTCYELGISSIGENRIQEAEKKLKELQIFAHTLGAASISKFYAICLKEYEADNNSK